MFSVNMKMGIILKGLQTIPRRGEEDYTHEEEIIKKERKSHQGSDGAKVI
jgi:hypothetical protein